MSFGYAVLVGVWLMIVGHKALPPRWKHIPLGEHPFLLLVVALGMALTIGGVMGWFESTLPDE